MSERPNILLILTDQFSGGLVGETAPQSLETPALNRLAAEGTRFDNAYCTFPLCTPSRASLLTGHYPHQIDATEINAEIEEAYRQREIGNQLASAGYECSYGGKWHVPDASLQNDNDHGFERLCGFNDPEVVESCEEYLANAPEEPFFLVASFNAPHDICEWARDQTLPWGSVSVPAPSECPPLPENVAPPPYEPECVDRLKEATPFFNGAMEKATPDEWRQYLYAYYRLLERQDRYVDRLLESLAVNNLEDDTVVVFTSDHGDGRGAHRCNQKLLLYEEMVNVPLIIRDPAVVSPEQPNASLVSNGLDIAPTIVDYAEIDPPSTYPGRSLRPSMKNEDPEWRDFVVTETQFSIPHGHTTYPLEGRMVRTDQFKYVVYSAGRNREQLFDVKEDPGEMVDLSNCTQYRNVLHRHREYLLEWCLDHDDVFAEHHQRDGVPSVPGFEYDELNDRI
jgi:arylsulfatase A-like enzyme